MASERGRQPLFRAPRAALLCAALLANGIVYLGLYSVHPDGVDYWNKNGKAPPELIVEAH